MICFLSLLQISSFIFRQIALWISEYSVLSVGVPFFFICLPLSLSSLVSVDSLLSVSPLYVMAAGGINASSANLFCSLTWNSPLWCIYLAWLGDHFCSLQPDVNPCFPSYQAMITTRVETVDNWNIKKYLGFPLLCNQSCSSLSRLERSMYTVCSVASWKRCSSN